MASINPRALTQFRVSIWRSDFNLEENADMLRMNYESARQMAVRNNLIYQKHVKPLWKKCPLCGHKTRKIGDN